MTHEAGAATILPEQEPDLSSIPPEIIAAGGRIGMTAAGIVGLYALEPSAIDRYANNTHRQISDEEYAVLERVGVMAYGVDEFTREVMAHLWNCRYGNLTIDAAVGICTSPALSFLRDRSDIESLSRHMSMHGSSQVIRANIKALEALAEAGALQQLYPSDRRQTPTEKGAAVTLHTWSSTKPPAEEYESYCDRRDLLAEIARDPRFRRYATSEFGATTMRLFLTRFVYKDKSDEQVRELAESFLGFISDDQNANHLEHITANHPELVDFLNPMTSDYGSPDMAQYCQELADTKPGTLSGRVMGMIKYDTSAEEKMLFARICGDTYLHRLGGKNGKMIRLAFLEAGVPWVLKGSETVEQKKAMLSDPVFVQGIAGAGSAAVFDRVERVSRSRSDEPLLALAEELYGTDTDELRDFRRSRYRPDDTYETASKLFRNFYNEFGLDCYELFGRWLEVGLSNDETTAFIKENIATMRTIESNAPGQQVCRWLRQERQIRHFGRYGADELLRQWRTRDSAEVSGIGLYASKDGNTSLRTSGQKYLPKASEQLDDHGITLRLYEAASPREVLIALGRARRKYGQLHFGYGLVHGLEHVDGTIWGSGAGEISYPEDLFTREADGTYRLPQSNLEGLGAVFIPGAPIAASTCFGAREGKLPAITRGWAIATGAVIRSTAESAYLPSVKIRRWPDNMLTLATHFRSDGDDIPTTVFNGQLLREQPDPYSKFEFSVPRATDTDETTARINDVINTLGKPQGA